MGEAARAEDTGRLAERLAKLEGLLEGMLPHLATKADIQAVREELSADVQTVREELSSVKYDTLWLKRLFWVGVVAVLIPLFRDLLGFLP